MRARSLTFSLLLLAAGPSFGQRLNVLPPGSEVIYKAAFDIQGTSMNGFIAVRHMKDHVLHVALTSPMGNILLEMQWEHGRWKKSHAVSRLGKRRLFNMVGEDLLLLLGHFQYDRQFEGLGNEWLWHRKRIIPVWNGPRLMMMKILDRHGRPVRKTEYEYGDAGIERMVISHVGSGFSIVLRPIPKKN